MNMAGLIAHGFTLTELRAMTLGELQAWTVAVNEHVRRANRAMEKE